MSFNDGKGLTIVGSASIRSQQYAGDYDGYQVVQMSASSDAAAGQEIARGWQENIKRLRALPDVFIGDIKCGEIGEWRVIPQAARLEQGKIVGYNPTQSRAKVDALERAKIVSPAEADEARKLLPDGMDVAVFLEAKQKIKFHVIRWTPRDILAGRKKLRDGRVIRLSAACRLPGMAKLDVVAKVQRSRFTDFSVIYEFRNKGKVLNPYRYDVRESLREAVVAYKQEGNYFKVLKRLYTLARYENDLETIQELTPILNSDLGRLYHIVGDMRTLVELLQFPRVPIADIRYEVDQFVGRLSGIYKLEDVLKNESEIIGRLHGITKMAKGKMAKALERLADQLEGYLQYATKHVLESRKPLTGGITFRDFRNALGPAAATVAAGYLTGHWEGAIPLGVLAASLGVAAGRLREWLVQIAEDAPAPAAAAPVRVAGPAAAAAAAAAPDRASRVTGILQTTPTLVQPPADDTRIVVNPLHSGRGKMRGGGPFKERLLDLADASVPGTKAYFRANPRGPWRNAFEVVVADTYRRMAAWPTNWSSDDKRRILQSAAIVFPRVAAQVTMVRNPLATAAAAAEPEDPTPPGAPRRDRIIRMVSEDPTVGTGRRRK